MLGSPLFSGWGFKRQKGLVRTNLKCTLPTCSYGVFKNFFLGQVGVVIKVYSENETFVPLFSYHPVHSYSVSTTLTDRNSVVIFTATATCYLPSATGSGLTFRICNEGSGTVTINGNSTDTIKGSSTQTLTANEDLIITDYTSGRWA